MTDPVELAKRRVKQSYGYGSEVLAIATALLKSEEERVEWKRIAEAHQKQKWEAQAEAEHWKTWWEEHGSKALLHYANLSDANLAEIKQWKSKVKTLEGFAKKAHCGDDKCSSSDCQNARKAIEGVHT